MNSAEPAVRRAIDAYNTGDLGAVRELLTPDVEVHVAPVMINSGTYHGHEGFTQWIAAWDEAWEEFRVEVLGLEPIGEDCVLVEVLQRGRGAGSGIEVELQVFQAWKLRGELLERFHIYPTREEALAAIDGFQPHSGNP